MEIDTQDDSTEPEAEVQSPVVIIDDEEEEEVQVLPLSQKSQNICEASPAKIRKIDMELDDEDGYICTICYCPFANSGEHRLSCLACGHIFGKSCITKWLKSAASCPQCNDKARKKDIRILYVKQLVALDTAERDRALHELELTKTSKQQAELEIAKLRVTSQAKDSEIIRLRELVKVFEIKVQQLDQYIKTATASNSSQSKAAMETLKTIPSSIYYTGPGTSSNSKVQEVLFTKCGALQWKGEECRVAAYSEWSNAFVISHKFTNILNSGLSKAFGEYGVRIFNWHDMKSSFNVPVHQKEIRDMAFSPNQTDLLLTVGMDCKAHLLNVQSRLKVLTFVTESPIWSCAFSTVDPNISYVGLANGQIISYDIRSPKEVAGTFNCSPNDKTPVCRLHFVPSSYQASGSNDFSACGLLVQKLNSCWFLEFINQSEFKYHQLPLDGGFLSLDFEPISRHVLISARPTPKIPTYRHMVCQMTKTPSFDGVSNAYSCNVVKTFQGSPTVGKIYRPKIFSPSEGKVYVAANRTSSQVSIWDLSGFEVKQSFSSSDIVLDYVSVKHNDDYFLNLLTSDSLETYKYQQAS